VPAGEPLYDRFGNRYRASEERANTAEPKKNIWRRNLGVLGIDPDELMPLVLANGIFKEFPNSILTNTDHKALSDANA
jgi:hypothetical protein